MQTKEKSEHKIIVNMRSFDSVMWMNLNLPLAIHINHDFDNGHFTNGSPEK